MQVAVVRKEDGVGLDFKPWTPADISRYMKGKRSAEEKPRKWKTRVIRAGIRQKRTRNGASGFPEAGPISEVARRAMTVIRWRRAPDTRFMLSSLGNDGDRVLWMHDPLDPGLRKPRAILVWNKEAIVLPPQ